MTVTTGEAAPRLGVLRIPAFRWFFAGQFASSFGDFLVGPALAFAVLDLTGSAGDLGLVLAARTVPIVAFMLLGGVLADRLPKHRVMLGADLVRVAGQGGCAGLLITGHAHIWQLMALQAVNGAASAMFTPAVSGLIQQTVPTDHRQAANALHTASRSVSMVAGPLVSALLVVSVGSGWALAADAATFARRRPGPGGPQPHRGRSAGRLAGVPLPYVGVEPDPDGLADEHVRRGPVRARPPGQRPRLRRRGRLGRDHGDPRSGRGDRRPADRLDPSAPARGARRDRGLTPVGQALAGPVALQLGVRRSLLYVGVGYLAISLAPLAVRDVRGYAS